MGGIIRKEAALNLMNSALVAVLAYNFLGILLLAAFHRKKIGTLSVRPAFPKVYAGAALTLPLPLPGAGGLFRFPGITIRYELRLATRDGRQLRWIFDPAISDPSISDPSSSDPSGSGSPGPGGGRARGGPLRFPVPERGAYYGAGDLLVIADCLGFFRLAFPVPPEGGPRLLALPGPAPDPIPAWLRSGGTGRREKPHFQRTDDLIDHRPYIPGDDPRRINWKLYGHGGDLLIREGDPQPPPYSRLVILLDTQADPALYTPEGGRRGVDLLCENALALAAAYLNRGVDILAGYTGGGLRGGTQGDLAEFLAYPAALPLASGEDLPGPPGDRALLILALPREAGETSALDRCLKKRRPPAEADLIFLYRGDGLDEAAAACVRRYRRKGGCHARYIRIP
jgi:hypothetical protein